MTERHTIDEALKARLEQRFPPEDECRRNLASAVGSSAQSLVETFAAFLVGAGLEPVRVAEVLRSVAEDVTTRELVIDAAVPRAWSQLSDAVGAWWRDPDYLDVNGRPQALPEFGPAPSVESLLCKWVDPSLRARAKELLRSGGTTIRDDGRWTWEDIGYLRVDGDEGVQRLHMALSGMLATFVDNQIRRRDLPVLKNFDRSAHVSRFPVSMIPELRARAHSRIPLVLHDFDQWMTRVADEHTEGPIATVGITVFVHTAPARERADDAESVAGSRMSRPPEEAACGA